MITTKTGRIAEFTVDGIHYTERTALRCIPNQFRELFDGHSFKNFAVFSQAAFFASCADSYDDSPMHGHTVNAYRRSLEWVLENDSL